MVAEVGGSIDGSEFRAIHARAVPALHSGAHDNGLQRIGQYEIHTFQRFRRSQVEKLGARKRSIVAPSSQ